MMEHKEFIVSLSKGRYCLYLVLIIMMAIFGALFGIFSVIEENWTFYGESFFVRHAQLAV